ncbi:MAG: PLP-dependent aminotransferase family protein [Oscillospiraceae bacterium]|nr:PLP-dependent aminotransferase family protein [Oscillospiraceae bacterium]
MDYSFSNKVTGLQASAIREILKFTAFPDVISFAAGNPAPEAFPVKAVEEITQKILTENPVAALQYSITEGHTPLRETLKKRLASQNSYNADIDDVIITSGGQQGNELSCKVFLNEGDTLICEFPSFIGSINSFKSYNVNLVGVEMDDEGIDPEKLEATLKANPNTKLIYLIPNFQNPTGKCMSYERRKTVYALAQKYNVVILEDNPYGEIRFEGEHIPSIKSLDTDGRVIYCGSFSKVLAPGIRVGFVSAPKAIIQKIVVCKQVADVHTNILAQMLADEFLNHYDFEAHLVKIREIYRKKCGLMLEQIDKNFSKKIQVTRPQGGLFIWATLPDGCDMMGFCKKAVEAKVAVVPGNAFTVHDDDPINCFRLNFSTPTDEQLIKGCEILGEMSRQMFDKAEP